jgi:hypothetical protein
MEVITKQNINLNAVDNVNEFIKKPELDRFIEFYCDGEYRDENDERKKEIINSIYDLRDEIQKLITTKRIDLIINKYVFFDDPMGLVILMFLLSESIGKKIESVSDFKNSILTNLKYPAHFKNLFKDNKEMTMMYNYAKDKLYLYSMGYLVRNQVEYSIINSYNPEDFGLSNAGWDLGYGGDNLKFKNDITNLSFIIGIDEIEFLEDEEIKKYAMIYNTDFDTMKAISYQNYAFSEEIKEFQNELNMVPELRDLLFAELETKYPKLKELGENNRDSQSS